jgi:hypothetical protein
MSEDKIGSAIHDIVSSTTESPRGGIGDSTRASYELLLLQGDLAVPPVVSAIRAACVGHPPGDYYAGIEDMSVIFGIETAVQLLADLDTDLSTSALLDLLNTAGQPRFIYGEIVDALASCSSAGLAARPDVIPALIQAANGPAVSARRENLRSLYLLARKLGKRIPVTAEQAVRIASDLPASEDDLTVYEDFTDQVPRWPAGSRCAFFWYYGNRVERVRGSMSGLPYFAASVLANPGQNSAAWAKFPHVKPSARQAATLARTYPLPRKAPQPAAAGPAHPRRRWHLR